MRRDQLKQELEKDWMKSRDYTPRQIATKLGKHINTVRLWYQIGVKSREHNRTVVLETLQSGGRIVIKGSQIIDFLLDINC